VAIAIILVLAAMFLSMVLTNPAFDWSFIFQAMQQRPVLRGFYIGTLLVTVLAMVVGIVGGVILAVMRLSPNPVLSGVAWLFTWFFRSVPRYVLLTIMGALGILFQKGGLSLGIPFDWKIMELLGLNGNLRFLSLNANELFAGLFGAVLGLGLSEAAYMAEIARAGILSVDEGQVEAASALGMTRLQAMRRIVLPQAMRVIIPPTGNETISMLKTTSLAVFVAYNELLGAATNIYSRTYQIIPLLLTASIWYLFMTSVLTIGQYYLERHYARGALRELPLTPLQKLRMLGLRYAGGAART
jgi:polar amino acid transport system permease protein